jgi:hypothetical protein
MARPVSAMVVTVITIMAYAICIGVGDGREESLPAAGQLDQLVFL